jgi:DNA sulfur modification protein DndC
MRQVQTNLFEGISHRLQMTDSIDLTIQSLNAYGPKYNHWALAWSGGKDSTATLTLIVWLIQSKKIEAPKTLTVLFADTRLELTPLMASAYEIMDDLRELGIEVRVVMAEMDKRFFVLMFGRGIPPPGAGFRWCTGNIKIAPMEAELAKLHAEKGEKILMITGVRQGESAVRDNRIIISCSKNGTECGQGYYQETMPAALCDTLAPIVHWRVCHVWEWLRTWAPLEQYGGWSTKLLAEAYGGDEAEEINARTGCMGCPVASKDKALETVCQRPGWAYLSPLLRLREVFERLRSDKSFRKRHPGGETKKDGTFVKNQQRLGPLTMAARRWGMAQILAIQSEVNESAKALNKPMVDILNQDEVDRINELIKLNTWPDKWTGNEPTADTIMPTYFANGTVQPLIDFGL